MNKGWALKNLKIERFSDLLSRCLQIRFWSYDEINNSSNIVFGGIQVFIKFVEPVPSPNKLF
jgi:hypothetical protein